MAFGELITSVHADLAQLDKDLNTAREKLKKFYEDANRMGARLSAGGAGLSGAGGGGGRGGLDVAGVNAQGRPLYIPSRVEENDARRFLAVKKRAIDDNLKLEADARKRSDAENLRQYRSRIADEKTVANFKADADKQALGLAQDKSAKIQDMTKEEMKLRQQADKGRLDAEKEVSVLFAKQTSQNRQENIQKLRQYQKDQTVELQKSAQAAARLNQHFDKMKDSLGNIANQAKNVAGFLGLGAFAGIGAAVAEAFNYNRQLQLTKLSLATDLQLTTKIVDQHGKQVSRQKELNVNLAESQTILNQIRKEAESTTLTEKELQAVSRIGLAGGLRGGAAQNPAEAIHLVAQLGNLAKILQPNLGPEALVASVRSVTGASPAVRRTALGQVLDLDPKQLRAWKEQGTLVQHLLDILHRADNIVNQANASFEHLWSTLISKGQRFLQLSIDKVFEKITGRLLDLNKELTDEKIETWAKQFSEELVKAYDAIQNFGNSDGFKAVQTFFKFLVNHATEILNVFLAVKGVQALKTGQSILQDVATAAGGFAKRGAGGAVAGVEEAGAVGAGAVAGGLPAFMGAVGGLAGFLAAAVPVVIAGLVGYGIGNLLQATVGPLAEAVGHYFGGTGRGNASLNRSIAGGEGAVGRRTPLQRQLASLRGQELQDRQAFISAQTPDEVASTANILRGTRAKIARLEREGTETAHRELLHRVALEGAVEDEAAQKKRRKAQELEAWLHRLLAKGTEDEVEQLKLRYKADAESVYAKLGVTKRANQVVAQLHQQLLEKIRDYNEESANEERKRIADLRDDKLAKLEAEYHDNLKTIKDSDASEADQARDRLAAFAKFQRDKFDQQREWSDKARELAKQAVDDEIELQRTRQNLLKETAELQKKFAKQAKDLAREEEDAARDYSRAQKDRQMADARLFGTPSLSEPGRFIPNPTGNRGIPLGTLGPLQPTQLPGPAQFDPFANMEGTRLANGFLLPPRLLRAAQPAFVDEQESIRTAAEQLFNRSNIGAALAQRFQGQGQTQEFAQANAGQQLRELINQAQQPGGAGDILSKLRDLGLPASPEFAAQIQHLGTRALNLQGREEEAQHAAEQEQIKREKEDANRPVEDARRRIADLADQEAQARKDYQEGIKRIQDEYKQQVVDITGKFTQLGVETAKLTREMAASNQRIPTDLRGLLAPFQHMMQGQARGHVASALAPVYHITFGPGSLSVKGLTLAEIKTALHDLLVREGRAAAPPRR